ncbi:MAG: hypothetical protein G01um101425_450 [Candidatus Peregrinibacteria bacterium Gr01-1014_25]|nr:MAG: hypothetical protein G01um101425_450 [Candidatus Peregrinibacteria bacterium Gr01-1014_25]
MPNGDETAETTSAGDVAATPELLMEYLRAEECKNPEKERCCICLATAQQTAAIRAAIEEALRRGAMVSESLGSTTVAHTVLTFRVSQALLQVYPSLASARAEWLASEPIQNAMRDGNAWNVAKIATVTFGILDRGGQPHFALLTTDEGPGFDLERVPNPNHEKYISGDSGRGLFGLNGYLQRLEGNAIYMPMKPESPRTNTLFIEVPLPSDVAQPIDLFRTWYANLLQVDEDLRRKHQKAANSDDNNG